MSFLSKNDSSDREALLDVQLSPFLHNNEFD